MKLCSIKPIFKNFYLISKVRSFYSYGIPIALTDIAIIAFTFSDRYFIKYYLGFEEVGIYTLYSQLASLVSLILVSPFKTAIGSHAFKLSQSKLKVFCSKSFNTYIQYSLSILVIVLFLMLIIPIISKSYYFNRVDLVPLIIGAQFLYGLRAIVGIPLHVEKNSTIILIIFLIGSLYNVIINYYLIKHYGLLGASFSILTTQLLIFSLTLISSKKYLNIKYSWSNLFVLLGFILFSYFLFS